MERVLNSYVVKLIGEGVQYWVAELPNSTWDKIINIMKTQELSLSEIIFDLEILNQLGFESWEDIPFLKESVALRIDTTSKIEVKLKNKRIINIKASEIIDNKFLFPLYNIKVTPAYQTKFHSSDKLLIFGYNITGTIQSYQLNIPNLDVEKLTFLLSENTFYPNEFLIENMAYNNKYLIGKAPSCIIRSFFAEFANSEK